MTVFARWRRSHLLQRCAVVAGMLGLAAAPLSTPARAAGGEVFESVYAGTVGPRQCLAVWQEESNPSTYNCSWASDMYRWDGLGYPEGSREFHNVSDGRCLDDSYGFGLRMVPCNGMPYQRWYIRNQPDGTFTIWNQGTSRCLDDSAYGLRTMPCNGLIHQKWKL